METTEQQAVVVAKEVPVAPQVAPESKEKKGNDGAQSSMNREVHPVSTAALGRGDEILDEAPFLRKKEGDGQAEETRMPSADGDDIKEEQTHAAALPPPEGSNPAQPNVAPTTDAKEQQAPEVKKDEAPHAGEKEGALQQDDDGTDTDAQKKASNKGSSSKPRRSRKGNARRPAPPRPYVSPVVELHTHALPIFVPGPSPLDLAYPRKSRSSKPTRRPRSSRAAINRLKQAAHGALPLGASLAAAALGGTGGRTGRAAGEDESEPDSGEEVEEFESSEYDSEDSDAERRGSKKARREAEEEEERRRHVPEGPAVRGGMYQGYAPQHQQYNRAYPSEAEHRRQALLHQLSSAPPHIRHQLLAQLRQQQQQGGSSWGPVSPRAGAFEYQGGATQSGSPMAPGFDPGIMPLHALAPNAQQAAIQSILSRMTPQERHQFASMAPGQQRAALEELHRRHLLAARLAAQQPVSYQMGGPVQPPVMMHGGTSSPTTGGGNGYHGSPGSPMVGAAPNPSQALDPQRAARLQAFLSTLPPSVKARVAELPREQQAAALVRLLQLQQQQQRAAQQQQTGNQPFPN